MRMQKKCKQLLHFPGFKLGIFHNNWKKKYLHWNKFLVIRKRFSTELAKQIKVNSSFSIRRKTTNVVNAMRKTISLVSTKSKSIFWLKLFPENHKWTQNDDDAVQKMDSIPMEIPLNKTEKKPDWKCWGTEEDPHQKKPTKKPYSYKTNKMEFENSY